MKKIKGVSLVEGMVSLSLLMALATGILYYMSEQSKKDNSEIFGLEVLNYIKLVDNKVIASNYYADQWPTTSAYGYDDFKTFMYNNFNAVGTSCGVADGWVPIVDRTNNEIEQYKERPESEVAVIEELNQKKLLNCNYFKSEYYFLGLTPQVRVTIDNNNKYINSVDFIFRYEDDQDLKDNFTYIKRSLDFMKAQDVSENYGSHYYTFINVNNFDIDLKPLECFNLGKDCAIKASFRRNSQQDSIRVDGLNSIEQGIVTFKVKDYSGTVQSDLVHGILKNCDKWTYSDATKSWSKNNNFKCGVGMFEGNLVAGLLDGASTSKTIFLNQQCNSFNVVNSSSSSELASVPASFIDDYTHMLEKDSKILPCGIYEEDNEYIVVTDYLHAEVVKVASDTESKIEVYASPEMIAKDYDAKLIYDANPTVLNGDDPILNPSKADFQRPSRSSVERVRDPSLSFPDNTIRNVETKNLTIYEDLIVDSNSSLPPEQVFTTGELEVLNSFTINQETAIDTNLVLTQDQKNEAKRNLSYSNVKGNASVEDKLLGGDLVVGNDKLFNYDDTEKEYTFKNNAINDAEIAFKNSGSPVQIASKIAQITANNDIDVTDKSEAKDILQADSFQFKPDSSVVLGGACDQSGVVGSDSYFELYICQSGKWESIVQNGGISAFNSNTCPLGWKDYTEADGRSLIGTGYFDTLHAGVVRYKTGDKGGEAKHTLTIDEMPTHSHRRPIIQHICAACHANLGLAKIATGSSNWQTNFTAPTTSTGGNKPHENRSPFYAIKFCTKGQDSNFDYIDANIPNPNDIWTDYEPEYGEFLDVGAKYDCFKEYQLDNISDPSDPKLYEVDVCKQDQSRIIKEREINSRTSEIRYTGITSKESITITTQESWRDEPDIYTECLEKGEVFDCTYWNKDEDEVNFGIVYTKEKTCSIHEYRYKQKVRRNWITGSLKIVSQNEEECFPSPTKTVYQNSVGTNVDKFESAVSFEKQTPLRSFGGFRLEIAGSFNMNSNASATDFDDLGIPITNDKGHTVMIKIRRQERAPAEGFTCEVALYSVNGNEARTNTSNSGNTFNWINGFKFLRFYNASNNQIGSTVNLGPTNVRGNYTYKISSNDVCSLTNTLYNNINSVKSISIDDI